MEAESSLERKCCTLLPTRLYIGDTVIEIESADQEESSANAAQFRTIDAPLAAGQGSRTLVPRLGTAPAPEELTRWFEALVGVQTAAASSPDFFTPRRHGRWSSSLDSTAGWFCFVERASGSAWPAFPRTTIPTNQFSRLILETVTRERRTFYQGIQATSASLEGVDGCRRVADP